FTAVPNSENMCSSFTQLPAEVSQCSSSSPCYPHWNKWGPWNQCSNSCGVGVSIKRRVCTLRGRCMGESIKYKTCSSAPCWSEWSPYSPCSTSCNGGVRTRDRICSAGNLHSTCNGSAFQSNVCNTQVCPLWTAWSNYGECSTTCGKGFRHRSRSCLQGNCDNRLTLESVSCNLRFFCPTWSPWSVYSCCSVSCGIGTQTRERTCYHGQVGEIGCIGPLNDTIICNIDCHNQTQHAVSRNMEQCGLRVAASSNRRSSLILKIFGGNISRRNSWPWQASLQEYFYSPLFNYSNWLHFCGGTIVSSQWVITAAHCLQQRMKNEYSIEKFSAVLGLFRLNLQHNTQRIGFKRTFIHSDFQRAYFTYKNDVALIQLDRKLQWTSNIRPACLPGGEEPSETESCYITGWGRTRTNSSELSSELRESIIPILSNKQCRQLGSGYNTINMTLHLCAGDPVLGGRDTCQGDSGGPIICNRSGIWYVAGITSHSLAFCGARNNVGIYMRTTGYETWIHDVMTRYNRPGC
uniref:Uncharacterized LOC100179863 n=1 Tax=Ciona intestinalis TaxID=7719 RepID=F6SJ02_CIOIN